MPTLNVAASRNLPLRPSLTPHMPGVPHAARYRVAALLLAAAPRVADNATQEAACLYIALVGH